MSTRKSRYHGHRFPPEIISHAIWLYYRFSLSFRDVEDLLAERGITISYESVRRWCLKFGPRYSRGLKRREGRLGDIWHVDEVFIKIGGQIHYLWRAVDQDGDVIDILVQRRRNSAAAKRFFRKALQGQGAEPIEVITDNLRSYPAAAGDVLPGAVHTTERHANNACGSLSSTDAPEGTGQDRERRRRTLAMNLPCRYRSPLETGRLRLCL